MCVRAARPAGPSTEHSFAKNRPLKEPPLKNRLERGLEALHSLRFLSGLFYKLTSSRSHLTLAKDCGRYVVFRGEVVW